MTRRRACWLAARHIALWPWPAAGEPPIPSGHPWLDALAWLRDAPSRRWLITFVWLAVAVATAGAGLAMATVYPVLLRETPAATSPAAGRASAVAWGAAGAHLTDSRPGARVAHNHPSPAGHTTTPTTQETP